MPSKNLHVIGETEPLGEINGDLSVEQRREQVLRCLARIIAHDITSRLDVRIKRDGPITSNNEAAQPDKA